MTLSESSYEQSDTLSNFLPAFLAAQSEMEALEKNQVNEYFNNDYADLAQVLKVAKPALNKNGIVIMFFPCNGLGTIGVHTKLMHVSGEWISNTISGPLTKQDPQGVGIALTYFRRYGLSALISLAQEDKDGNAQRPEQNVHQQKKQSYPPRNNGQQQQQRPPANKQNQNGNQRPVNPPVTNKPTPPEKPENFIIPICNEIKAIAQKKLFLDYILVTLPQKNVPTDQRKILWDFCIGRGEELGLIYDIPTKTWINIDPEDGILAREMAASK